MLISTELFIVTPFVAILEPVVYDDVQEIEGKKFF